MNFNIDTREYINERVATLEQVILTRLDDMDKALDLASKINAREIEHLNALRQEVQSARQLAQTPERQAVLRLWLLEDEVTRLANENAELQSAIANAVINLLNEIRTVLVNLGLMKGSA